MIIIIHRRTHALFSLVRKSAMFTCLPVDIFAKLYECFATIMICNYVGIPTSDFEGTLSTLNFSGKGLTMFVLSPVGSKARGRNIKCLRHGCRLLSLLTS